MRLLPFMLGLFVVVVGVSGPAQAQNYPWCAYYGGVMGGGGTNCGFSTFQQCQATVSGIGGFCDRNTQYVAPGGPAATTHYRPRHKQYHPQP
jgi:hypothetical protein